jgi:hypothetical protein
MHSGIGPTEQLRQHGSGARAVTPSSSTGWYTSAWAHERLCRSRDRHVRSTSVSRRLRALAQVVRVGPTTDITVDCRSLGQPGFSQALLESREVFRSAIHEHTPEIRDPKCRIDLAQARHGLVRLIKPPGEGMAGRSHARCASVIWLLQESLLRLRAR